MALERVALDRAQRFQCPPGENSRQLPQVPPKAAKGLCQSQLPDDARLIIARMDLSTVKDLSIVIAGAVAFVGFMGGIVEYWRRTRELRADHFIAMRRRFLETPAYKEILDQIVTADPALATSSVQERRNFIGFLEEIGLMVDSRLIRPEVAYYMFGHYVRLADESEFLWAGLDKSGHYWLVFRSLAAQGKNQNGNLPDRVRF